MVLLMDIRVCKKKNMRNGIEFSTHICGIGDISWYALQSERPKYYQLNTAAHTPTAPQ